MMRDRTCDSETSGPAKCRGKTLVLGAAQWSGIVGHLKRGEPEAQQSEQQRQYEEYLRKGSRAITKGWDNTAQKVEEKKAAEKQRQQKAAQDEGEARYKALMEMDEKKRMEQISVAQQMMDRAKSGPRQLDSAFLMAEVLGTREQQRRVRAEEAVMARERRLNEGKESIAAAQQNVAEMRDNLLQQTQQRNGFKRQLFEQIQTDKSRRRQMAENTAADERRYREAEEKEMQEQLEMEQLMLQRKKETQRRNALEAMKMAEQRRLRNTMVEDVETKMISILANGNNAISDMRKRNDREQMAEKDRMRTAIMNKVFKDFNEKTAEEQETLRKAVIELEEKHQRQEQAKLERTKRIKAARIQAHINETEQAKQLLQKQKDEQQWAMANRFRNDEVNAAYGRQCKEELRQKQRNYNAVIQQQMAQNVTTAQDRFVRNQYEMENEKDDDKFFEYAQELVDEAEAKKRPILPLLRVVEKYKKENGLVDEQSDQNNGCVSPVIKYERDELRRLNSGTGMPSLASGGTGQLPWKVSYWRARRTAH